VLINLLFYSLAYFILVIILNITLQKPFLFVVLIYYTIVTITNCLY